MRSDYKKIGDFIRKVNVRNTELNVTKLMGINIDKFFMPSVANTVGTDMSKYRIVKKGQLLVIECMLEEINAYPWLY